MPATDSDYEDDMEEEVVEEADWVGGHYFLEEAQDHEVDDAAAATTATTRHLPTLEECRARNKRATAAFVASGVFSSRPPGEILTQVIALPPLGELLTGALMNFMALPRLIQKSFGTLNPAQPVIGFLVEDFIKDGFSADEIVNLSVVMIFEKTPLLKAATKSFGENSLKSKMGGDHNEYANITLHGKPTMHRGETFLCVAYDPQTMPPWNEIVIDDTPLPWALEIAIGAQPMKRRSDMAVAAMRETSRKASGSSEVLALYVHRECGTSILDHDKKGANTISKQFKAKCPTCNIGHTNTTGWLKHPEFVVHHKLPWVKCKHCDAIRHDDGWTVPLSAAVLSALLLT